MESQMSLLAVATMPAVARPLSTYQQLYRSPPTERIRMVREGLAADAIVHTSGDMGITRERLLRLLRFPAATVKRKLASGAVLPQDLSERVLGLQKLIGQVEVMVEESGDPAGFDGPRWLAHWLDQPAPALGGARPADFMDTAEGQEMVASLLAKIQSGAYA
ncbi:MAG: DUF2384 domain-containing protein [Rhodocyclaceae bacterium]|nr:DUF2384 domain-containing protein [Rhodocyclaceae bacterium]